ncbi:3999_t:CDS:2 [Funneliformis geosporum]|uniref:3999_t:CDS:1 n=1 Tax=Funneliformis geosporum TaxID=1117311 RepID=A0A9W4T5H6_9GLOM|nr:3999_t:CDS:2 [Funneliformis geosporum]
MPMFWHLNLIFPEHSANITISLFVNEHNHELRLNTYEFKIKYRELSKELMDEIEIMTKYTGIESTSRVEGMNAIIKRTIRSNFTLCQLVDQLSERLISEIQ